LPEHLSWTLSDEARLIDHARMHADAAALLGTLSMHLDTHA